MQTNLPQITSTDLKAVRDFLTGLTDEVRIAPQPTRRAPRTQVAVPVTHGISRARARSGKAEA